MSYGDTLAMYLQLHIENSFSDLWSMCEGSSEKWRTGLSDIGRWDAAIIKQEETEFLTKCPDAKSVLEEHFAEERIRIPPILDSYIFSFMIEMSNHPTIQNREYWSKFGQLDRQEFVKYIKALCQRRLKLSLKNDTHHQVPSAKVSERFQASEISNQAPAPTQFSQTSHQAPPQMSHASQLQKTPSSQKTSHVSQKMSHVSTTSSKILPHDSVSQISNSAEATPQYAEPPQEQSVTVPPSMVSSSSRAPKSKAPSKVLESLDESKEIDIDPASYGDELLSFTSYTKRGDNHFPSVVADDDNITGVTTLR